MTFIKKSLSLNGHQPFHNIITNRQIAQIEEYNNILALAHHQAQNIIDNANLEANNIISHANEQAQHILKATNNECQQKLEETHFSTEKMLNDADHQVQDILLNSEHKATQEVWNHAQQLINSLEQTHNQFYSHTHDVIKNILATIIKKLTSNLEVQDRMQIIVHQVFAKAQEIEYATLFFNPKDFEKLPSLHIPQNWKLEKDNMLEQGLCRLVGAGGEWKTSIKLIEQKMLEAVDYDENNNILNSYQNDNKDLTNDNEIDNKDLTNDNEIDNNNNINSNFNNQEEEQKLENNEDNNIEKNNNFDEESQNQKHNDENNYDNQNDQYDNDYYNNEANNLQENPQPDEQEEQPWNNK